MREDGSCRHGKDSLVYKFWRIKVQCNIKLAYQRRLVLGVRPHYYVPSYRHCIMAIVAVVAMVAVVAIVDSHYSYYSHYSHYSHYGH